MKIFKSRWTKFAIASIVYILLFVVWTGNLWLCSACRLSTTTIFLALRIAT